MGTHRVIGRAAVVLACLFCILLVIPGCPRSAPPGTAGGPGAPETASPPSSKVSLPKAPVTFTPPVPKKLAFGEAVLGLNRLTGEKSIPLTPEQAAKLLGYLENLHMKEANYAEYIAGEFEKSLTPGQTAAYEEYEKSGAQVEKFRALMRDSQECVKKLDALKGLLVRKTAGAAPPELQKLDEKSFKKEAASSNAFINPMLSEIVGIAMAVDVFESGGATALSAGQAATLLSLVNLYDATAVSNDAKLEALRKLLSVQQMEFLYKSSKLVAKDMPAIDRIYVSELPEKLRKRAGK